MSSNGALLNDIAMFSIESPIKRNATIQMIVRKTPNSKKEIPAQTQMHTRLLFKLFLFSEKLDVGENIDVGEEKHCCVSF